MKTLHFKSILHLLPPAILAISLLAVYLNTLAPGLTWANDGSDGGDLIAAAATGGVPHPTGYPLYLIFARLFQLLPVGTLAYRTNLMSAIFAVLAAVLVYEVVTQYGPSSSLELRWLAGMAAGYAFGLAPLVWSQAVITEVYALQAFLTALILYLYTRPTGKKHIDYWRGLALGLAMGNHLTTLLLVPFALALGSIQAQGQTNAGVDHHAGFENLRFDRGALLRQLAAFVAGVCLYLIIPLRAFANPPVNWGNAITPARLGWLVSGGVYRSYYLQSSLAEIVGRMQAGATLLLGQFGLAGVLLGLIGAIVFWGRSRLYLLTTWTAIVSTGFAVLYGSVDSYVYLMPLLLCFAIWVGLGLDRLLHQIPQQSSFLQLGLGLAMLAFFVMNPIAWVSQVDASKDARAESFGRQVLSTAPEAAIIFAKGDEAVFSLWYFHFALSERPDVSIVAEDLLHFDWYQETLRATYPSLIVPGPFPWPETILSANPLRTACYAQYSEDTKLDCLPPPSPAQ